ncbi:hypothetical protein BC830DRAFT_1076303 [Chytriomyces sp. MP71]|nr:hypothetical protein BC830DRAFT_1076303 [Chytriomyces sp. MP71]
MNVLTRMIQRGGHFALGERLEDFEVKLLEWKPKGHRITIQSAVRGYLARRNICIKYKTLLAAIKIQHVWRGFRVHKSFAQQWGQIIFLQSCAKTQAKKVLKTLRLQAKDVKKVKEKTVGLEAKVVSLSQALHKKTSEAKEIAEKSALYEATIQLLKEKLEASDNQFKSVAADLLALKKQSSNWSGT